MAQLKNGVPYRLDLVPQSKWSIKCPYPMTPKKITIHNTDNEATSRNEVSYMNGNNLQVSYHVAIDEKEAVQGLPFNRNGWHAGDGGNGYGNRNTIGVEMCRNYDRTRKTTDLVDPLKKYFDATFINTVKVVAQLCVDLGIVANYSNIKQHHDWSGKNCPSKIRKDKTWNKLVDAIIAEYNRLTKKPASKPATPAPTPTVKRIPPKSSYTGGSIVDYLNSIKWDASVGNRRKLAVEYGVKNYDLSGPKNTELLKAMRAVTASTSKPTVNTPSKTPAKPAPKKKMVHLPATSKTWRTYKLGVAPVKANSDWSLTPSKFGGLSYEILGTPQKDVVTIMTSKGKRNIFVGAGTGAIIK